MAPPALRAGQHGLGAPVLIRGLDRAGLALTLALPLFLLHERGIAEALLILLGLLFMGRCLALRD